MNRNDPIETLTETPNALCRRWQYASAFRAAKHSILIESQHCGEATLLMLLEEALKRGVRARRPCSYENPLLHFKDSFETLSKALIEC